MTNRHNIKLNCPQKVHIKVYKHFYYKTYTIINNNKSKTDIFKSTNGNFLKVYNNTQKI